MSKYDGLLQGRKAATETKRMGRPRGKASDPDYRQVTIYLRRDTHGAARKRLIDENREFSELVEDLVSKWLATPAKKDAAAR
jgi:hypothetical protein